MGQSHLRGAVQRHAVTNLWKVDGAHWLTAGRVTFFSAYAGRYCPAALSSPPRYAISVIIKTIPMEFTHDEISAFQQLYSQHTGQALTIAEAREVALEVIAFVRLLHKLDLRPDLTGE